VPTPTTLESKCINTELVVGAAGAVCVAVVVAAAVEGANTDLRLVHWTSEHTPPLLPPLECAGAGRCSNTQLSVRLSSTQTDDTHIVTDGDGIGVGDNVGGAGVGAPVHGAHIANTPPQSMPVSSCITYTTHTLVSRAATNALS
jgi:hypothetical protein